MRQKPSLFSAAFRFVFAGFLTLSLSSAAFAADADAASVTSGSLPLIYGVVAALSLLLLLSYCIWYPRKKPWFAALFSAVFVTNLGYFVLSVSRTLGEALLANRIAYLGSACLPLCMLMIILDFCDIRPHKAVTGSLIGISTLVFLLAASGGYLPLYYQEVSLQIVGGAAKLHKVYGPLHGVYALYLLAYLAAMVISIICAAVHKRGRLWKFAPIVCAVVLLNLAIWFVEQQIHWTFEFLSVSYIVSTLLLLLLNEVLPESEPAPQPSTDPYVLCPQLTLLTQRELDVLRLLLTNKKRRQIAADLFVTENTVKKHTAHIYEKLGVSDRSELLLLLNGIQI